MPTSEQARDALIFAMKLWTPDHPERGAVRARAFPAWQAAFREAPITFVSRLREGVRDISVWGMDGRPRSLHSLLVSGATTPREKHVMQALVSGVCASFKARNLAALALPSGASERVYAKLGELLGERAGGTPPEEADRLCEAIEEAELVSDIDVFFEGEVVGSELPVSWRLKALYTRLAFTPETPTSLCATELRDLVIYGPLLDAESLVEGASAGVLAEVDEDALIEAGTLITADYRVLHDAPQDELLGLHAQALTRLLDLRGQAFFERLAQHADEQDPLECLERASRIAEPLQRTQALAEAAGTLASYYPHSAREAARQALLAAHSCPKREALLAHVFAMGALIDSDASPCAAIAEAFSAAHEIEAPEARAEGLTQVAVALRDHALRPDAQAALSRSVLGGDVHYWGHQAVTPLLVDAVVSQLPSDDDAGLLLQKLFAHPRAELRVAAVGAMDLGMDRDEERVALLLDRLDDRALEVRAAVIDRLGFTGGRELGAHLEKHLHKSLKKDTLTPEEMRTLLLALARIDADGYLALFNACLGDLANPDRALLKRQKPLRGDSELQKAAIEVLFYLNDREARRLLYHASEHASGPNVSLITDVWRILKDRPFGDATLPRSRFDPAFDEDDIRLFGAVIRGELLAIGSSPTPAPGPAAQAETKRGLFGRIKGRFKEPPATAEVPEPETPEAPTPAEPDAPPTLKAALRIESRLVRRGAPYDGEFAASFALYVAEDATEPVWREAQEDLRVEDGALSIDLGQSTPLPQLPSVTWLEITVGEEVLEPRLRLTSARSVISG